MRKLFLLVASLFFIPAIGLADENTTTEIQVNGTFYLISDGEASLQRANRDIEGEFVIPSEIEHEGTNYPVTAINDEAFYNWNGEICPVTSIQIPSSIVSIGKYAFGTTAITEMEIPSTVKKVGSNVFMRCPNLKKVVINGGIEELGGALFAGNGAYPVSKSLETFILGEGHTSVPYEACFNCENLTNVKLPSTVTAISSSAFYGCIGLKSIDIPASVTQIGHAAFRGSGLTSIELPEGMTILDTSVFSECKALEEVKLPSSLEKIGLGAFFNCTSLENIVIPDNVTEIGTFGVYGNNFGCFCLCTSLKSIKLGNSLEILGDGTFSGCSSLTNIEFGNSLKTIGVQTFSECASLKEMVLPSSVESLSIGAFSYCTSLQSITLGKSLETIGRNCFYNNISLEQFIVDPENQHFSTFDGILCDYEKRRLISAPNAISGSITIPSNIKTLGSSVFQACKGITELILSEGLENIEEYAISECSNLHHLSIPASVSSISLYAFSYNDFTSFDIDANNQTYSFHDGALCNNDGTELLTWLFTNDEIVTIPNSVLSIWSNAFSGMKHLTEVNFNDNLQSIGQKAFFNCNNLKKASIPNSVSYIGSEAFSFSGIVEIEFPTSLSEIPTKVCSSCDQLKSAKLPDSIECIGDYAFNLSGLQEVIIPKNVRSIGNRAFTSLTKLRCLPLVPPELLSQNSINDSFLEIVEVYESVLNIYKSAPGWNEFKYCTFIGIPDVVTEVDNMIECDEFWTVHSIDGSLVMNTNDKSRLSSLPKGIYIINGKKVIK